MRRFAIVFFVVGQCSLASLPADAQSVREAFKRVNRAVVIVRTTEQASAEQEPGGIKGVGSGILVSGDGMVVTAAHVVQTVDEITVEFIDGTTVGARVVASEPQADVALLQLDRVPAGAVVAPLGNSDDVEVGDPVFVVGAPYGIGHTLTVGHVSARHKPNTIYSGMSLAEFLQTDAAINRGNSGGPMFTMAGEVVGIVSHIISRSGGFEGLGFVVTSNMARRILLERRSFWSGLDSYLLSGDLAKIFNLPQAVGLLIQRVAQQSPSARIGLRGGTTKATVDGQSLMVGGDVILEVQGIPISDRTSYERIQERLGRLHPGARMTITILREGRRLELTGQLP